MRARKSKSPRPKATRSATRGARRRRPPPVPDGLQWRPDGERLACRDAEAYRGVVQALVEHEVDYGGTCFMASVLDSRGLAVYLPAEGVPEALHKRLRELADM